MTSLFQKYQRPLLLVLALFALVTFSITQPLTDWINNVTQGDRNFGTITLPDGRDYKVTFKDMNMAQRLYDVFFLRMGRNQLGQFLAIDLGYRPEEEEKEEETQGEDGKEKRKDPRLFDRMLLLYCLAKESGLQTSDHLVEKFVRSPIVNQFLRIEDKRTYTAFCRGSLGCTPAEFEDLLQEFFRIKLYLRILELGENTSIDSILEDAAEMAEEFKLQVVRWEAESFEKALTKEKVDDKTLAAFLEELPENEKQPFVDAQVTRLGLAYLPRETTLAALKKSVEDTKPAKDTPGALFLEYLSDLPAVTDGKVQERYERDKEKVYKIAKKDLNAPIRKVLDTKLIKLKVPVDSAIPDAIKLFNQATGLEATLTENARKSSTESGAKVQHPGTVEEPAQVVLNQLLSDNPDLGYRVVNGKLTIFSRKLDDEEREKVEYVALEKASPGIKAALEMEQALGLVLEEVKKAAAAKEFKFKEFMAKHFPLFKFSRTPLQSEVRHLEEGLLKGWTKAFEASAVEKGKVLTSVYTSDTVYFLAQLLDLQRNKPRPVAEIRKDLRLAYNKGEAAKRAKKAAEAFLDDLKAEGAKAQPKKVAAIEKEIKEAVDTRIKTFTGRIEAQIKEGEAIVANQAKPAPVRKQYEKALAEWRQELAKIEAKRETITEEERKNRQEDLDKVSLEKAGDAFEKVAKKHDLPLVVVDWFPKNLHQQDSAAIEEIKDDARRFAMGQDGVAKVADLEKGRVSDLIEDPTNKAHLIIRLVDKRKRDFSNLTPKEVHEQIRKRKSDMRTRFPAAFLDFESLKAFTNYRGYRGYDEEKGGEGVEADPKDPGKEGEPAPPKKAEPKKDAGGETGPPK